MAEDLLTSTLDLLRRLPPQSILENTSKLIAVLPQLSDDLLSTVDQPLEVRRDKGGREYLVRSIQCSALVSVLDTDDEHGMATGVGLQPRWRLVPVRHLSSSVNEY